MSDVDAAGGRAAGGRRIADADLPWAYASRPDADPLKAQQFWGTATSTPPRGTARPSIRPEVPDEVDPAMVLRRLAELAVTEAVSQVRVEQDVHTPKVLPRRADAQGGGSLSGGVPPARPALPARESSTRPSATGHDATRSRRSVRAALPGGGQAPVEQSPEALRSERVEALAALMPVLKGMSEDRRPEMRSLYALCYSLLAVDGQAPADREVWRALLGLSKYDQDATVRRAADTALADLERHGTIPHAR